MIPPACSAPASDSPLWLATHSSSLPAGVSRVGWLPLVVGQSNLVGRGGGVIVAQSNLVRGEGVISRWVGVFLEISGSVRHWTDIKSRSPKVFRVFFRVFLPSGREVSC